MSWSPDHLITWPWQGNAWEFWHTRQPSSKQRIIDAETNNMSEQCGIQHIEDVSYNAIAVYWNPLDKPAFLSCAIQVHLSLIHI